MKIEPSVPGAESGQRARYGPDTLQQRCGANQVFFGYRSSLFASQCDTVNCSNPSSGGLRACRCPRSNVQFCSNSRPNRPLVRPSHYATMAVRRRGTLIQMSQVTTVPKKISGAVMELYQFSSSAGVRGRPEENAPNISCRISNTSQRLLTRCQVLVRNDRYQGLIDPRGAVSQVRWLAGAFTRVVIVPGRRFRRAKKCLRRTSQCRRNVIARAYPVDKRGWVSSLLSG